MMQKGQILIFLLVGILVLAAAGGAFYLGRQTTPTPSPTPVITSQTPQPVSSQFSEGQEVKVNGIVVKNHSENPSISDVPSHFLIRVSGEEIKVVYHYGEWPRCINDKPVLLAERLKEDEEVEVFGKVTNDGISTCDSTNYYIKKMNLDETTKSKAQVETQFGCVPKFAIESAPELTASEAYAEECFKQTTEDSCNKVDIFRASTNNFGNSDGTPDCKWVPK